MLLDRPVLVDELTARAREWTSTPALDDLSVPTGNCVLTRWAHAVRVGLRDPATWADRSSAPCSFADSGQIEEPLLIGVGPELRPRDRLQRAHPSVQANRQTTDAQRLRVALHEELDIAHVRDLG